jgi:hypothetical protein
MVPVAEFDDPQALRDRFALLGTLGAAPGGFGGPPPDGPPPEGAPK